MSVVLLGRFKHQRNLLRRFKHQRRFMGPLLSLSSRLDWKAVSCPYLVARFQPGIAFIVVSIDTESCHNSNQRQHGNSVSTLRRSRSSVSSPLRNYRISYVPFHSNTTTRESSPLVLLLQYRNRKVLSTHFCFLC